MLVLAVCLVGVFVAFVAGAGCDGGCRQTEEITQALEDNQVKLLTMKASRFVKAFEQDVDRWERALSLIGEIMEMLLTVQRQWMYLEVRSVGLHPRRSSAM